MLQARFPRILAYVLMTYIEMAKPGIDWGLALARALASGVRDAPGSRARALKAKVSRIPRLPDLRR